MKRQKRKQDALILKMLPKLNSGADIAENFESATLFSSTVVDFAEVTKGKVYLLLTHDYFSSNQPFEIMQIYVSMSCAGANGNPREPPGSSRVGSRNFYSYDIILFLFFKKEY